MIMIIGLTGTIGAGKGTVAEHLVSKGFMHFSVRDILTDILRQENKELTRENFVECANTLRAKHGSGYIIDLLIKKAISSGKNAVVESIRTIGEVETLRKHSDVLLWAIDADQQLRYERILERKLSTDHIDFATFVKQEQREMNNTNPEQQNIFGCIECADNVFWNNGNLQKLFLQIDHELKKFFG